MSTDKDKEEFQTNISNFSNTIREMLKRTPVSCSQKKFSGGLDGSGSDITEKCEASDFFEEVLSMAETFKDPDTVIKKEVEEFNRELGLPASSKINRDFDQYITKETKPGEGKDGGDGKVYQMSFVPKKEDNDTSVMAPEFNLAYIEYQRDGSFHKCIGKAAVLQRVAGARCKLCTLDNNKIMLEAGISMIVGGAGQRVDIEFEKQKD